MNVSWTQPSIYLAVIIDLYSACVVGWSIDRRMKKALVIRALMMPVNLRKPRGPDPPLRQTAATASFFYRLKQHGMCSMPQRQLLRTILRWRRFFGSLNRMDR